MKHHRSYVVVVTELTRVSCFPLRELRISGIWCSFRFSAKDGLAPLIMELQLQFFHSVADPGGCGAQGAHAHPLPPPSNHKFL